tara:strand:+ start:21 stop:623 length:603 start_codon:yes stop_codon:yes gene_type:complete
MSYFKIIILIAIYSTQGFSQVLSSEDTHYFDKYIEGIFKTIENPPVECLKLFKESDESKMLTNKDLLMCYTLIENGIPQQLKFDILNHSPHVNRRSEEIKNEAIFGTCYRKDPSSKYYDPMYAELEVKSNKTDQDEIYLASLNTHCSNLHSMHFETDYIMKESKRQKKKRRRATFSTIGVLIPTVYTALFVYLIMVFRGV